MVDALAELSQRSAANAAMAAADTAVGGAVNVATRLSALTQPSLPPNGLGYGTTGFDQRMANLAWMLDSNLGMRVACVSYDDGWDFHDSQVSASGAEPVADVDHAGRLPGRPRAARSGQPRGDAGLERVRPAGEENDSGGGGTDHGAGGLALLIGTRGTAGCGEFPGISDSRSRPVGQPEGADRLPPDLHHLLGGWMGTDPAEVIPNAGSYSPLRSGRAEARGDPPRPGGAAKPDPTPTRRQRPADTSGVVTGLRGSPTVDPPGGRPARGRSPAWRALAVTADPRWMAAAVARRHPSRRW